MKYRIGDKFYLAGGAYAEIKGYVGNQYGIDTGGDYLEYFWQQELDEWLNDKYTKYESIKKQIFNDELSKILSDNKN